MQMTLCNICRKRFYCLGVNGFFWRKNSLLKSYLMHYLSADMYTVQNPHSHEPITITVLQQGVPSNSSIPVGQKVLLASIPSYRFLPNHQILTEYPTLHSEPLQLHRISDRKKEWNHLETFKWRSPFDRKRSREGSLLPNYTSDLKPIYNFVVISVSNSWLNSSQVKFRAMWICAAFWAMCVLTPLISGLLPDNNVKVLDKTQWQCCFISPMPTFFSSFLQFMVYVNGNFCMI